MTKQSTDRDYRSLMQNALLELKQLKSKLTALEEAKKEPIAIVGLGCRFPGGANHPDAFWRVLQAGVDATTEVPKDRWDMEAYYDPHPETPGKMYSRYGSFLTQVDHFDPLFFEISPREAVTIDPQQRLLLEVSWQSLERAGLSAQSLRGSQTGVFVGVMNNDYSQLILNADANAIEKQYMAGGGVSSAAGRLAYFYGWHGPTVALNTACSSSLVAVHFACSSLRLGECSLALAAGVNLILSPYTSIAESGARMLAKDGRCKTFDAAADGFGRGEGCGVVLLKRLSDAIRDRDPILAVIRGSAVNQDGRTSGLTVPNELAQETLIRQALSNAEVKPEQIQYIEAHGTGTSLGDPIEVGALSAVFGPNRSQDQSLVIGSVKTNMGHLEGAAGIAGLIKVVLQLQHEEIAPHLHVTTPNPYIPWDELPIKIPTQGLPWTKGQTPRLAGVSAFSYVGTNAHVIVAEAPLESADSKPTSSPERPLHLLTLSAKTPAALHQLASDYQHHLNSNPGLDLADICLTANVGRSHFKYRLAMVAATTGELENQLKAFTATAEAEGRRQKAEGKQEGCQEEGNNSCLGGLDITGVYQGQVRETSRPKIAFLFTGQGSQYINMGRQLYTSQPQFRQILDHCDQILRPYLDSSLLEVLYPPAGQPSPLDQTAYTQPALFAIEYALYQLWQSWGITPDVLLGHSVGEYVAACVAGVFSLEDGLKLIANRARLMQALPQDGEMVAILATPEQVETAISPYRDRVSIAAYNGRESLVISGQRQAIRSICTTLTTQGVKTKRLSVSHAFHSPLMEPMLAEFEQVAKTIRYHTPQIRIIANLTGTAATSELASADYWVKHIRQAVQFAESMTTLQQLDVSLFVEIGPKPILLAMAKSCLPEAKGLWLPSLRAGVPEWQQLLDSLAQSYVAGVAVDWSGFEQDYSSHKVSLPTYPFERQRYWIETGNSSVPQMVFAQTGDETPHPLLGQPLHLAGSQDIRFQSWLSPQHPPYLQDHRIYDQVILPGVAYLEMALMAGKQSLSADVILSDVVFAQALALPADGGVTVQTLLTPEPTGSYRFEIFSLDGELDTPTPQWTSHASGKVEIAASDEQPQPVDLDSYLTLCPQVIEIKDYYQQCQQQNLNYGERCQGIAQLWRGDGMAVARLQLPAGLMLQTADYQIHPVLLDASLQAVGAVFPDATDTYLPVGLGQFRVYQHSISSSLWCHVQLATVEGSDQQTLAGNIRLFDHKGTVIAAIEGLSLKRISRATLQRMRQKDTANWLYKIDWQPQPLEAKLPHQNLISGNWLIFADSEGLGDQLAAMLRQQGADCIRVTAGNSYQKIDSHNVQLDPNQPQHFQELFNNGISQQQLEGIIHLGSIPPTTPDTNIPERELNNCATVLHLVQALSQLNRDTSPRLMLVTRGTQAVTAAPIQPQLSGSSLWGMARTIALEYPELKCQRLDLSANATSESNLQALLLELAAQDIEDQIAIREGVRYVARLVKYSTQFPGVLEQPDIPTNPPVQLKLTEYGVLENLTLEPQQRRPPTAKEVEIQVRATGLNFREVLVALGMMQDYYAAYGIDQARELTFGFECAGTIVSVGEKVYHLNVGDEVLVGMTGDAMASFITVGTEFVVAKPENLSFEAAATIPLVFLTADYGLNQRAKIQPGERVLIHAAAGGVGQAAVQLAQQVGAEVFATASPSKWDYLKSMGVEHLMNSRNLDFAAEIMELTQGQGVDIVLNSLTGEFIPKSLQVLAKGGRFIEIGRIGIYTPEQVKEIRADISYFPFDLAIVNQQSPGLLPARFAQLIDQFRQGLLQPLPQTVFALEQVVDGFRYLAGAKHIGKVVISLPENHPKMNPFPVSVPDQASYLITGGLGALGMEVAAWLVNQGARHLVLTGRRQPSPQVQQQIAALEQQAQVLVVNADVSQANDLIRVLETIDSPLPPLRGIIHAAGVIDDGVLRQQTRERFQRVMAAKVAGAWNLHSLTENLPLDFFVCFSSVASFLGSPGQSNYAAANAFMDTLAHYRRAMGLAGLSINWGIWADVGMAASSEHRDRIQTKGIGAIPVQRGLEVLEQLLSQSAVQVGVIPINWSELSGISALASPFFHNFTKQASENVASSQLRNQLEASTPSDAYQLLLDYVRSQVAKIIGWNLSTPIDQQQGFSELGMDSLAAVELRNSLQKGLACSLPSSLIFDYPTMTKLVDYLANQVLVLDSARESAQEAPSSDNQQVATHSHLDELSDDEATALLLEKLENINY